MRRLTSAGARGGAALGARRPVDRLAGADLMQWQADVGPVPHQIGGLLVLAAGDRPRPAELVAVLADRLARVPALRRRPVRPPIGGGGWYWLDDDPETSAHLRTADVASSGPADLLAAAADAVTTRPRPRRSPWTATVLVAPDGRVAGVVLVLHHVLADGVSGLATIAALVDGAEQARAGHHLAPPEPPSAPPGYADLVRDAWTRRVRGLGGLRHPRQAVQALRAGRSEVGHGRPAARTVLDRPTGPHRVLDLVEIEEEAVRSAARSLAASVNDLVVVAAVESLRAAAAVAGEQVDRLTVSVPVAVRPAADMPPDAATVRPGGTRNAVGVLQLEVPATGPLSERVRVVTRRRRARLQGAHGRSLPLVLLAFRLLRVLHLVRWFLDHQRLVNTLVTAVPAPAAPVSLAGAAVTTLVPLVLNQGNTTTAFATSRYAGRLTVTVTTDPDVGPDATFLAERVRVALVDLVRLSGSVA